VKRTIEVLNQLEQKGVFSRYAIGGAMGAVFYIEPFLTFDLDILSLPLSKKMNTTCGDAVGWTA
jgi:hypothetical protein